MLVTEVMTENPIRVREDATVADAIRLLDEGNIRHLPVLNAGGDLVGMLSDRDLRALMPPEMLGDGGPPPRPRVSLRAPVSVVMRTDLVSVEVDAPLAEAVDLMLQYRVGAVPVLGPEGDLVGIVSYVDVLQRLRDHL